MHRKTSVESSSDSESESDMDASSETGSDSSSSDAEILTRLEEHLALLSADNSQQRSDEANMAPLFCGINSLLTDPRSKEMLGGLTFKQYGLLAGHVETLAALGKTRDIDPRIFYNVTTPSSVFICGSQGSGKSHTLSCLLENCLIPSSATELPNPLTGLVFHFDSFASDTGGSPCEAAYLSSHRGVKVRVLCPPTNIRTMRSIYSKLDDVVVEELAITDKDLNTSRMLDLMVARGKEMPLYMHIVNRVLRDMRVEQQTNGSAFNYERFKRLMMAEELTTAQSAPFKQRLDTLESFMPKSINVPGAKNKKAKGNDWTPKAGQLTVVDLSCPCITAEMACMLFNICLSIFLEHSVDCGKVIALDEAHKYMTDSLESQVLTESLLQTIRLQRHLGTRVIISTQEPSVSPKLLDLCSVTIVHRFTSPAWLMTLKEHLAGVSSGAELARKAEALNTRTRDGVNSTTTIKATVLSSDNPLVDLFGSIVNLRVGEALIFAPSAIIGSHNETARTNGGAPSVVFNRLAHGILKARIRSRVTADGGRSKFAV